MEKILRGGNGVHASEGLFVRDVVVQGVDDYHLQLFILLLDYYQVVTQVTSNALRSIKQAVREGLLQCVCLVPPSYQLLELVLFNAEIVLHEVFVDIELDQRGGVGPREADECASACDVEQVTYWRERGAH